MKDFLLSCKVNMEKPSVLYKYQNFDAQSLQNLKAQSVYFGSPLGFNDPYDCKINAVFKDPTDDEIEKLVLLWSQKANLSPEAIQYFKNKSPRTLKSRFIKSATDTINIIKNEILNIHGITCFSEINDDLLMWSHYGGQYKGFCLEFSTNDGLFNKLMKVVYKTKMPKVDVKSFLSGSNNELIVESLFCTKSKSWEYEKEWRIFYEKAGTLFGYEAINLKGVYFGPDIDGRSLEIICLILKGQNPDVKLWRGSRSKEAFKVNFEPFTYTSYLEAKKLGLR